MESIYPIRDKIEYVIALINEFGQRFGLRPVAEATIYPPHIPRARLLPEGSSMQKGAKNDALPCCEGGAVCKTGQKMTRSLVAKGELYAKPGKK